ncbi:MAG: hypothetical protein ACLUOI_31120 [Eisenbergiella sp.]
MEGTAPEQETTDSAESFYEETRAVPENIPYENKMLRIIVDSSAGDKVNIQLPVKIIRQMLMVTGKLPIKTEELEGIDLEELTSSILECIDNETLGNIIEVRLTVPRWILLIVPEGNSCVIIRSKDVNMWLPVPGSGRCSGRFCRIR